MKHTDDGGVAVGDIDDAELAAYLKRVAVLFIPEDESHVHGECDPEMPMWIRTEGMNEHYHLPELEMRNVPWRYVEGAAEWLNRTALYTTQEKPIRAGESVSGGHFVPTVYEVVDSPDQFWKGRPALRLVAKMGWFECTCESHVGESDAACGEVN